MPSVVNDRTGQVWWNVFDEFVFLVVGPASLDGAGVPCHPIVTLHDPDRPGDAGKTGWRREYVKRVWESDVPSLKRVI